MRWAVAAKNGSTVRIEVGNPWMKFVPTVGLGSYRPTLGGYPLQVEHCNRPQVSIDNIREIVEQLGKPFLVTAHEHGVLFHWNGTAGAVETYAALGFRVGRGGKTSRALADLCAELGIGERALNRQRLSCRRKHRLSVLFHDRTLRDFNAISRKRWVEEASVA